jgi:large subunit ribosomal protein L18
MDSRLMKKQQRRTRIKLGIRKKITGTAERPRLSVFRSNAEVYAQIIDDIKGNTLIAASSLQPGFDKKGKTKTEIAHIVGKQIAELAVKANITHVVFDRGGYLYHGRVKSLAEGAREGGLIF